MGMGKYDRILLHDTFSEELLMSAIKLDLWI